MAAFYNLRIGPVTMASFISIAWAESDFHPGCVENDRTGHCSFGPPPYNPGLPQGNLNAVGILQEGNSHQDPAHPSRYPIGVFQQDQANACGASYSDWGAVYYNPLCAFEWAYAYYAVNGFGFWPNSYGNQKYWNEYNYLTSSGPCSQVCTDPLLRVTQFWNARTAYGFWVNFPGIGSLGCNAGQADYCVIQLLDLNQNPPEIDVTGCMKAGYYTFYGDYALTNLGDRMQAVVWVYTDSSCSVPLTAVVSGGLISRNSGQYQDPGNNACFYYTEGQCGGFDYCAQGYPDWIILNYAPTGPACPHYW